MNDIDLKIIVERAVRPVLASFGRKRKMREELLAHVSNVFDEEFARLGDERAALERTAQRFGNPAELTAQLQATIPASDAIDRWLSGQPGESTALAAARLAAFMLVVAVAVFFCATLIGGAITEWPTQVILFTTSSVLTLPAYFSALTFATEWLRVARYEQQSWLKAGLLTLGWLAFSLGLLEGLIWLNPASSIHRDIVTRISLPLWVAAAVPWLPWGLSHMMNGHIRYHREWANLQLD